MNHNTALLVIDAQVGIIEGPSHGPVHEPATLLQTMKKVIEEARDKAIPVIYIQDTDVAAGGEDAFAIHPQIAPLSDETVIFKKATDSFHRTNLHDHLQAIGVNHLVIIGCKTEYCVDSACRKATTLGYDVTLVKDGHSTSDSKALRAEQIIAHHNTCLHGLSNLEPFIFVRSSDEDVFVPKHDAYR